MLRYMLDTNICIYVMKGQGDALRARFNENAAELCISSISLMELIYGAEKSERRSANLGWIESFAARLDVLSFGDKAAAHCGQIRADLARKGMPIGPYDGMIAGHARSEGLTIVTNNEREFSRVDGLLVENWMNG